MEQALVGRQASDQAVREACAAAAEGTNPPSDLNGSADYRRHLATVLTRRARPGRGRGVRHGTDTQLHGAGQCRGHLEDVHGPPARGRLLPGATVTEVTEEGFSGTVKVKLGPIAMLYAGSGSFVERDDQSRRAVIEARGKDKRATAPREPR